MKLIALAAAGAALVAATPALADRAPTATEAAAIEKAVRAAGFVSWEGVELDDDGPYWEVDDARMPDGKRYDLKLRPGTYEIVKRELED
jgi:hypothetical protein